jgi:hypothetical protein
MSSRDIPYFLFPFLGSKFFVCKLFSNIPIMTVDDSDDGTFHFESLTSSIVYYLVLINNNTKLMQHCVSGTGCLKVETVYHAQISRFSFHFYPENGDWSCPRNEVLYSFCSYYFSTRGSGQRSQSKLFKILKANYSLKVNKISNLYNSKFWF